MTLPKTQNKKTNSSSEVEGLLMHKLQSTIRWRGNVRLHMLGEDTESLLSECDWPKKSGNMFYACASTGLLFDKQSGRCLQSSSVSLLLDSVSPVDNAPGLYEQWIAPKRMTDYGRNLQPENDE